MAIHHLTPPIRGGERLRLPSSQIGPVTQAIRAMRAAEPSKPAKFADLPANLREIRLELANRIEAYTLLLDAITEGGRA